MRSFRAYAEVSSSEIHKEDRSFQLMKGDKSSRVQKEKKSSQVPKGGRSSWDHKEGRVPASSPPAKTSSKVPKIHGPKKLVATPSATRFAPGLFFQCRHIQTWGFGILQGSL